MLRTVEGVAALRLRIWSVEGGALRLAYGDDPGWTVPLPGAAGEIPTPDGPRWFSPMLDGNLLWLDTAPDPRAESLRVLVGWVLESDVEAAALSDELATRYEEIDLLYTINEILGHTVRLEVAATTIVREVSEVVGAERASIAVFDEAAGLLRVVAAQGFAAARAGNIPIDDPHSIAAQVVREGEPQIGVVEGDGAAAGPGGSRGYRGGAYMSVPIRYQPPGGTSRCVGVINLTDRRQGGRFTATDQKLVTAAASQIGAAIELARLFEREHEQQRLLSELELARDLQRSLLPDPAVLQGDARVAVRFLPAEEVGGDFYTFSRLGLGLVGVMIGDVSSHGFSAALVMAAVMAAAGIHTSSGETPDRTLAALRDSLSAKLASTDTYLTVFYGILDPIHRQLVWANAGHPHAFRLPGSGRAARLDATSPPLGLGGTADIGRGSTDWDRETDLLCVWTDGLVDAQNESGERYGEARLLAELEAHRTLDPERIVSAVMADANAFAPHPADDRTLLVLHL